MNRYTQNTPLFFLDTFVLLSGVGFPTQAAGVFWVMCTELSPQNTFVPVVVPYKWVCIVDVI